MMPYLSASDASKLHIVKVYPGGGSFLVVIEGAWGTLELKRAIVEWCIANEHAQCLMIGWRRQLVTTPGVDNRDQAELGWTTGSPTGQLNSAYITHLDQWVQLAEEYGIYIMFEEWFDHTYNWRGMWDTPADATFIANWIRFYRAFAGHFAGHSNITGFVTAEDCLWGDEPWPYPTSGGAQFAAVWNNIETQLSKAIHAADPNFNTIASPNLDWGGGGYTLGSKSMFNTWQPLADPNPHILYRVMWNPGNEIKTDPLYPYEPTMANGAVNWHKETGHAICIECLVNWRPGQVWVWDAAGLQWLRDLLQKLSQDGIGLNFGELNWPSPDIPYVVWKTATEMWPWVAVYAEVVQQLYHNLTVMSTPIIGVPVTVDGTQYTTNTQAISLTEGSHTIVAPATVQAGVQTYHFLQWEDGSTNPTRAISLLSDKTVICTYQMAGPTTRYLTILPALGGTTNPPPSVLTLNAGTVQPVVPIPNSGYKHTHWIFDGVNQDPWWPAGSTINITMDADHTVQALFELATVTIQVVSGGNGSITPSGSQTLTIGQPYQFNATPNVGYVFDHWDLGGTNLGNTPSIIITASADMDGKTLTAIFAVQQVTLNIATNGNGSVNYANGPQTFNVGDTITFIATPAQNNVFSQWTLDSITYTANPLSMPIVSTMNGKTLTAYFAVGTIALNVVAGANGMVSPSGTLTLTIGQSYQFAAIPNSGYQVDHWDLSGQNQGSSNPLTLTASASMNAKTLTALFTSIPPRQITMNIATSGNGSVNLSIGQHTFNVGDRVTFTATPATNNAFSQWTLNGTIYTANPVTIQITDAMNGQTLTALFVLTSINLSVISGANGSATPSGNMLLTIGQSYLFNATANVNYSFDHWDLGGANLGSTNPISILATADMNGKTLTALFTLIPPVQISLNIRTAGSGVTNPTVGTQKFNVDDSIMFSAIPNAGQSFTKWTLDGTTYTDNPLILQITEDMNGKTITAEFTGPGFPIWTIPVTILGLGAIYLATR